MNNLAYSSPHFNLAGRLETGKTGPVITSGPAGPGLRFNGLSLHNEDDPISEAHEWIDKSLGGLTAREQPGLALVFGLGLGWHLKLLRERYPGIRLVVFEPEPEMRNICRQHGLFAEADGPATLITSDWGEFEKAAGREIVYGGQAGVVVVAPDGYRALRPEAFGAFDMYTRQELMRRAVIDRTRENTNEAFLENLARNAGRAAALPDLMRLKGLIPPRPAFIVGSGPSLDQSAPLLKNIGDRGVILAAASSLKPLLAYGVSPDVVLTLESSDTSGYLELSPEERLVLGQETVLALASSVHPAHFKVRGFHQAVFHLTAGEAQTFGCGLFLPQGGNAGSAAFALAYCWGLDPLILVAQDQAYANGRLHAGGTPGTAQDGSRGDIAIRGLGDSRVTTDSGLLASLNWFAEAAKTIRRRPSPPALFNAAAAGAVIPGFSQTDLGALTASLAPAPSKLNLARALAKSPPASKEEIQDDLAQMAGLINTLRRLARMDHKKAFAEIREIGAISKFLAQILAGAAAADSRGELLGALDKADGLMSLMLSSFQ